MDTKIIYDESKGFEIGVPARDLTSDEWQAVDADTQKRLLASGMYKLSEEPKYKRPVTQGES